MDVDRGADADSGREGMMEEGKKDILYQLAVNGTTAEELPVEFDSYEIEKDDVQSRYQEIE